MNKLAGFIRQPVAVIVCFWTFICAFYPSISFANIDADNIHEIYEQLCINKGMIKGNIKVDPLIMIKTDEFIYATR